jgi:GNAT superfamily N-acetyltransferase
MEGWTIRHILPDDYRPIITVLDDWWGGRQMRDMLPKLFFVHFRPTSFAAEQEGRIVGFVIGFVSQTDPSEAYIHFVGVHLGLRGSGLGRELYETFFKTALALGCRKVYLTNLEAKTAIWIAKDARSEHMRAIQWLNETTPPNVSFYLVRLSAYRIAGSDPAPLFQVITGPSKDSKIIGEQKKELAARHVLRRHFWEALLARSKSKGVLWFAQRSPTTDSWLSAGFGVQSGISLVYSIWLEGKSGVEVYIDTGETKENKRLFDSLSTHREAIETAFGGSLLWERLDERQASRVRSFLNVGGIGEGEEKWPAIQDGMIDAMDRLAKGTKPILLKLKT